LSSIESEKLSRAIETEAERLQKRLNLERGPLMRVGLMKLGHGRGSRVMIVVHHLAVDAVSWKILFEDLERAYEQARTGGRIKLSPKTTSYKTWSEKLQGHARSEALKAESAYWEREALTAVRKIPLDNHSADRHGPDRPNDVGSARNVLLELTAEQT